jgi:hypothetical protein
MLFLAMGRLGLLKESAYAGWGTEILLIKPQGQNDKVCLAKSLNNMPFVLHQDLLVVDILLLVMKLSLKLVVTFST